MVLYDFHRISMIVMILICFMRHAIDYPYTLCVVRASGIICILQLGYRLLLRATGRCPDPRMQYQTRVRRETFGSSFASCIYKLSREFYFWVFLVPCCHQFHIYFHLQLVRRIPRIFSASIQSQHGLVCCCRLEG